MQNYSTFSDDKLLDLIQGDDFAAFDELYHRYAQRLVSYIHSKLDDVEESKDVVQEIFVSIWVDRKNLFHVNSISNYLYKIALNKSLNVFRKNKVKAVYIKSFSTFLASDPVLLGDTDTESDREKALNTALIRLPEKMRAIFELRYFDGLSNEQVAKRLNISHHTVATQMKRALKSIRKDLNLLIFISILINL